MSGARPLPKSRWEGEFRDFKEALSRPEAETEASRCIDCFDAPCIQACPTAINIPQFIARIAGQNPEGAARTILSANIFGLSCAQACPTEVLCEGACVYHSLNKKPIQIGRLQRYATEIAYGKSLHFFKPGSPTGKKIALIGAGPASLACAHELRVQGHETVVFEKAAMPGGLNTYGIAPYKMRAETSLREVERIVEMGVEIRYGEALGGKVKMEKLLKEYDAVFLGMGLGPDSRIAIEGADSPKVSECLEGAVDFISRIKTLPQSELPQAKGLKSVLIIGGGNTALDACRELKGLGVEHVYVSYRRGEEDMSGYKHEFQYARQEGVEFLFHTLPVRASLAKEGVRLVVETVEVDASGETRRTGTLREMDVGLVLFATGQAKLEKELLEVPGLVFEKGRLQVDPKTGRSGNPKVYAGGDLVNGGMEVVNAVAEGKRAALGIDSALRPSLERARANG